MGILTILIYLIVFCAIASIVWWAVTHFGLPQPVLIVCVAVLAIVALLLLFSLLPVATVRIPGR